MRRLGLFLGAVLLWGAACTTAPQNTQLRALQSSGPSAFVCLGKPDQALAGMARPLTECSRARTETPTDFSIPHLYALITQPLTGEVAVVDLTTKTNALIDQDAAVPGASFLPVGALPSDIVATPGGSATFVANAQANFEGIYALPSNMLRASGARLTSWPSCRLPAAPEHLVLLVDPVDDNDQQRPSCDAAYGAPDETASCRGEPHCHGDLALDAASVHTPGRYKLAVTLPSEGGIAIVDAQALLDQEAGAAQPCRIERWLPLQVELPPPLPQPPPSTSG
ncbi:MAG TPA: hypothetical protein ENK23_03575, partial [Sorangium sp.]|nr:hypothetical protein [Sorangium sp.]